MVAAENQPMNDSPENVRGRENTKQITAATTQKSTVHTAWLVIVFKYLAPSTHNDTNTVHRIPGTTPSTENDQGKLITARQTYSENSRAAVFSHEHVLYWIRAPSRSASSNFKNSSRLVALVVEAASLSRLASTFVIGSL
ncbi:hypothetical protein OGATHE_000749 [Ogataea polymorpha]|uniref:Uncharacterized protein n=1 Tax=Ogataea polymorpha TaxID=460523 RepID=A0A9P8TGN0_9ASCO|nr:hypothetical protein OGATHE_000749 [Ogataea polymorpha]